MEFHEKLQELRKRKGLTQEELAELLYVSRTAVSKWESGRGLPNIDSLKAIARYFSVSLDELLSGEEILVAAENDRAEIRMTIQDMVFGLLDCGMALLLFLPFFGQKTNGEITAVSLLSLTGSQPYLKPAFLAVVAAVTFTGILTLALQNLRRSFWMKSKRPLSLLLSAVGVSLFIISQQPYAAIFSFVFLILKGAVLLKRP